jgi:carbonic anhydrase
MSEAHRLTTWTGTTLILSLSASLTLAGCASQAVASGKASAESDTAGPRGTACGAAVDRPHDHSQAEWSYHETKDGPARWGSLTGDAACGAGSAQTPIDIVDAAAVPSPKPLAFANYDREIPVDLLDNGHTIQVNYAGTMSAGDPQITYDGKTYYLLQFHWHATSEHLVNEKPALFELHFVHKAADGALAVVGVLFKSGAENTVLRRLMREDPGPEKEAICADAVMLDELLPAHRGFYHYSGSLTTPPCSEGLAWFVMADQLEASAAQETAYLAEFHGTTNRPIQALNGRTVDKHGP